MVYTVSEYHRASSKETKILLAIGFPHGLEDYGYNTEKNAGFAVRRILDFSARLSSHYTQDRSTREAAWAQWALKHSLR